MTNKETAEMQEYPKTREKLEGLVDWLRSRADLMPIIQKIYSLFPELDNGEKDYRLKIDPVKVAKQEHMIDLANILFKLRPHWTQDPNEYMAQIERAIDEDQTKLINLQLEYTRQGEKIEEIFEFVKEGMKFGYSTLQQRETLGIVINKLKRVFPGYEFEVEPQMWPWAFAELQAGRWVRWIDFIGERHIRLVNGLLQIWNGNEYLDLWNPNAEMFTKAGWLPYKGAK